MPTYDRAVDATLRVALANGETFDASEEDLAKFGYVHRDEVYGRIWKRLIAALDAGGVPVRNLTDARINPLRHLVEVAIHYPAQLDHPEMRETYRQIAEIERCLQEHNVPQED